MPPVMIPLKAILWIVGGYVVLSSAASAMSMKDRSLYGFVYRFLRILTFTAGSALEQELHIKLPDVPTQASDDVQPLAPAQK